MKTKSFKELKELILIDLNNHLEGNKIILNANKKYFPENDLKDLNKYNDLIIKLIKLAERTK